MMHVLANLPVKPSENFLTQRIIPWFTDFTLLFMLVSAFSMCCGYYDRVKKGTITPAKFYAKRYHRTWPFFAMMVIISFVLEPSLNTFYQSFANLTMCFNLLPNPKIEVIGVGWFLGTVFTFYMLFPFFTFLMDNKKRGWTVLLLSLVFCYVATHYFSSPDLVVTPIDRKNIIYSAPFFFAGGMAFLYRSAIKGLVDNHRGLCLLFCVTLTVLRFVVNLGFLKILPDLIVFSAWLMYALGERDIMLNNKIVRYLSGISMEIYLCHMMFYRMVEKFHVDKVILQCDMVYVATVLATLAGAICFSHVVKYHVFPFVEKKFEFLKS